MLPYNECEFAVEYFEIDKTIAIIKLKDSSFDESDYKQFTSDLSCRTELEALYDDKHFNIVLIQIDKSVTDLEVTEERCVDLLLKKKKSLPDLLIRIPNFHMGKRMAYEPLSVIHTSCSEDEVPRKLKEKREIKLPTSFTALPPIGDVSSQCLNTEMVGQNTTRDLSIISEIPENVQNEIENDQPSVTKFKKFMIEKVNILVSAVHAISARQEEIANQQRILMTMVSDVRNGGASGESLALKSTLPVNNLSGLIELEKEVVEKLDAYAKLVRVIFYHFMLLMKSLKRFTLCKHVLSRSQLNIFIFFQVNTLSVVGGDKLQAFTSRAVRRLATKEVLLQLNWDGSHGVRMFPQILAKAITGEQTYRAIVYFSILKFWLTLICLMFAHNKYNIYTIYTVSYICTFVLLYLCYNHCFIFSNRGCSSRKAGGHRRSSSDGNSALPEVDKGWLPHLKETEIGRLMCCIKSFIKFLLEIFHFLISAVLRVLRGSKCTLVIVK